MDNEIIGVLAAIGIIVAGVASYVLARFFKACKQDREETTSHVDKNEVIVLIKDALIVLGSDSLRADKFGNDKFGNGESG